MPIKINIPGSKSHSNRVLILASLSNNTTTIKNVAICDDTNYLIKNLKELGVKIQQKNTTIKITGIYKNGKLNFPHSKKTIKLYTGNAGTTTRFLAALATLTNNEVIIDGDSRMRERPLKELSKTLNQLGAKAETTNGCPPLHIYPQKLKGGSVNLPGNISSQYLSAILMTAAYAEKKTTINIKNKLCSKPYIIMTLKVMKEFGLKIINKNFHQFIITPSSPSTKRKQSKTLVIESDASSASYFGAYAATHPEKKIFLQNIHKNSLQGDIKFLQYLKKMGCEISENKLGITVQGPKTLKLLDSTDMNETPDLVMTFVVLGLFTKGRTRISNISNLRIKETDRLQALENELKKVGATVKTGKDWIEINGLKNPERKKTIKIATYNDHRIAMAFGILTDLIPNLKIENPSCVSKSYPTFWEDLKICQQPLPVKAIKKHNIVLIGLRGSGKSKIGSMMAKKLNMNFVDTDDEIEKSEDSTIQEMITNKGWKYFRSIENKIAKKVAHLKNTLISCGGGTILDPNNAKALKKNGKIIYLHVKPEIAAKRIINDKNRPALTLKNSIESEMKYLYKQRDKIYRKHSSIIFERSENIAKDCNKLIELNLPPSHLPRT